MKILNLGGVLFRLQLKLVLLSTSMESSRRGVLTIAYGAPKYLRMGRALALSIRHHDEGESLAVVTDTPEYFDGVYDHVIPVDTSYGSGVAQKLHSDLYSPFEETLFIDSDCLLYGPTDPLWSLFGEDKSFGIRSLGRYTRGETHGPNVKNFDQYLDYFGVEGIFNVKGGYYYFDDSEEATEVFESSRDIYEKRDEVGLTAFKNAPVAQETVVGTALVLCGIEPIPHRQNTPHGVAFFPVDTLLGATKPIEIDVLEGESTYMKEGTVREPASIHYAQNNQAEYCYLKDVNRLELKGAPVGELQARVQAAVEYMGYWGGQKLKNTRSRVREMGPIGFLPGRILKRFGIREGSPGARDAG